MNERDSETIAGMLREMGYIEGTKSDADVAVLNTCSVRENADKRFFGVLGQLKQAKEERPDFVIALCGCMMQQEHIQRAIREKYPWVDMVFGTHNIHRFPKLLQEIKHEEHIPGERYKKDHTLMEIWDEGGEIREHLPRERLYKHKAFVNIMYGCNNFCTYCIVPYTRGRERSRDAREILCEINNLTDDGVKEVTLLGQNVNSYRGKGADNFAELLSLLQNETDLSRIRFMTSHPKDLSDELIAVIAASDKVCEHIHLPVQAGSDRILEEMNRRYTGAHFLALVKKLREARPGIAISTDIIVGFPGETEEDFESTLSLCEEAEFDSAFTFIYSPRPGTPAAGYDCQIPEDIKHLRFNKLVQIINRTQSASSQRLLGTTREVLVDGPSKDGKNIYTGRTSGFKVVDFESPDFDPTGKLLNISITETKTFNLWGVI